MRLSIAKNIIQASVEANLKLSGNTSEYTTPHAVGCCWFREDHTSPRHCR
jgi:hypothetical protein